MRRYIVLKSASRRIADIYRYSLEKWGREQARAYIDGLFEVFEAIARGDRPGRAIPNSVGINGRYLRYRRHFIFWIERDADCVAILSVLHDRMKMIERLPEDILANDPTSKDTP